MTTPFHSAYWAHALTLKRSSDSITNLARSIANARVDLNPHQVDAALFAIRSPFSKGVLLADEVGLGKTIEAGLVLAQKWAERHRKLLLILPASLRTQWASELEEKFYLPTKIIDRRVLNAEQKAGTPNPFDQSESVIIISYQFAAQQRDLIRRILWDLVVLDEAHRLRNVYKPRSKTAQAIQYAVEDVDKLLLTATPLQNSLLELYGLSSFVDPHIFGDMESFKEQFVRCNDEVVRNLELRTRLAALCTRTLRKQVIEYIRFTRRIPLTQEFYPLDDEHHLYDAISTYLQRDTLQALPSRQRKLMTMVMRKLLASSTFAIADTLQRLVYRLEHFHEKEYEFFDPDLETLIEEDEDEDEGDLFGPDEFQPDPDKISIKELIEQELAEIRTYLTLARNITSNAKGDALVVALDEAFRQTENLGGVRKAVVFTESRRTQRYLHELLSSSGYSGKIVLLNGSNSDPECTEIYHRWLDRHPDRTNGRFNKQISIRTALVEEFRDHAEIMIATEAGAEGLNLQFCSLVVNFDLPWNPQRVEQRIGRCHRYGQQHDVVVVNFLNKRNEADQRVYQLLSEKFQLFEGVFGSSDEVLGALESGVDIERRIFQVYQSCRTPQEIAAAFDALQKELEDEIKVRMTQTRQALLDNFDEEVHARLKFSRDEAIQSLDLRTRWLAGLTRFEFGRGAAWSEDGTAFQISPNAYSDIMNEPPAHPSAWYFLDWKAADRQGGLHYRPESDLAQNLIRKAIQRPLEPAQVQFDYQAYGAIVSALEPLHGRSGWLELTRLTVESLEQEEFLIFAGQLDDGSPLDEELCHKLIALPGTLTGKSVTGSTPDLSPIRQREIDVRLEQVKNRNVKFFDDEVQKLDRWADDLKYGPERELKEIDREISDARRAANLAQSLQEKLDAQKSIRTLEKKRATKRRELYESQDAIDAQRDELITKLEGQLKQIANEIIIFAASWRLD